MRRARAPEDQTPATDAELERQLRSLNVAYEESPAERAARGEAWVADKLAVLQGFLAREPRSRRADDARRALFRLLLARAAARHGDAWGALLYAIAASWAFKSADSPARAGGEAGARSWHASRPELWALWQREADRLARERGATWPRIQERLARKFRVTTRTIRARVKDPTPPAGS